LKFRLIFKGVCT